MQPPETIKLMGGALCLDFANSTDWTADGESIEAEEGRCPPVTGHLAR